MSTTNLSPVNVKKQLLVNKLSFFSEKSDQEFILDFYNSLVAGSKQKNIVKNSNFNFCFYYFLNNLNMQNPETNSGLIQKFLLNQNWVFKYNRMFTGTIQMNSINFFFLGKNQLKKSILLTYNFLLTQFNRFLLSVRGG
jgi:hypothetical protein